MADASATRLSITAAAFAPVLAAARPPAAADDMFTILLRLSQLHAQYRLRKLTEEVGDLTALHHEIWNLPAPTSASSTRAGTVLSHGGILPPSEALARPP